MDYKNTAVERIANKSGSDEEFQKNLVEHAKVVFGEDYVKNMANTAPDEPSFIRAVMNEVKSPKPRETLESKYLEPYVYPTLKAAEGVASAIALPIQMAAAPIGQAGAAISNLIQGKPQEEVPSNPIDYARKFGTTGAITRTLPIGNQPISQMVPSTSVGKYLKQEFPKAAGYAENISPNDIAAMTADIGLAKNIPAPEAKIQPPISLETAADYVRSMAKNNKQLLELESTGKIYDMAKMVQDNPDAYLHPFRPNKIYEHLMGKISPETSGRIKGTGAIEQAVETQNAFIEGLPRNEYSIPREELQIAAKEELGNLGTLEAGQRSAAEGIIERNIPITQLDVAKLERIKSANEARIGVRSIDRRLTGERLSLQSQIALQKDDMINAINEQPDLIKNPKFREDLQWLSGLEVADPSQSNVFPQKTRTIGNDIDLTGIMIGNKRNIPVRRPDNLSSSLSNPKMYDVLHGEHGAPEMIPNMEKTQAIGNAIDKIASLNKDLKDLSNYPVKSVNNKKLLSMISERMKLHEFVRQNADPSMRLPEDYMNLISKINEEPAGYASTIRRLGNKLQEPLVPGEVSTDIGAKNLAGRAMEKAARNAQDQVMGSDKVSELDVGKYQDLNKKISNMINMRDLMQGNLVGDSNAAAEFVPTGISGKSGVAGYLAKTLNRYVKPIGQPIVSDIRNTAQTIKTMQPGAAQGMGVTGNIIKPPLPMQLVKYQIPRDSKSILENKDIVIAKIAQMSNNPQLVEQFTDALNEHPEKLPKVLPALIIQFPDLFEPDDYNRVDGHIFDPMLKQKALKDIRNNKIMSTREKAFKSKRLDMEGILE